MSSWILDRAIVTLNRQVKQSQTSPIQQSQPKIVDARTSDVRVQNGLKLGSCLLPICYP
ncbi:hypothetical protein [Chamaesiphon sp. VAR_69_metabat_338]|uniref:hypothetical protein n=1 Tax=Chamaesiphon sp. VAR_69_metabat_338 TaxID=2964704 RepID=UPI00286E1F0B|nr:hypothetical protein [Chamaesiphon sp. VAR_69_metabat_338]